MVSSKVVPRAGNDLSERSKHSKQMKQPEGAQIKKVYVIRKRKNDYLNKRMMSFPFSESVWHQTWVQLASVCQIVITVGGKSPNYKRTLPNG